VALRTWLDIQYHFHRFLPEWYHGAESCKIEIILNEVFSNLAKVFVAWERTEPRDPGEGGCRSARGYETHQDYIRDKFQKDKDEYKP
jgi:hypothetical protein